MPDIIMPDITMPDVKETLLRMADELSTRAMLADSGNAQERADLLSTLGVIGATAESAGWPEVTAAATALSAAFGGPGAAQDSVTMTDGIAKLHAAIKKGASPPKEAAESATDWAANQEVLSEFFAEAGDHLTSIETQLMNLEHDPSSREAIDSIFRGFHTIKGLAGFLSFPATQLVAHETETLLHSVRAGSLAVTAQVIDVVLESADYLKRDLARLQEASAGGSLQEAADSSALIRQVRAQMSKGSTSNEPAAREQMAAEQAAPAAEESARTGEASPGEGPAKSSEARKSATESRLVKVDTAKLDFLVDMVGEMVIAQSLIRHDGGLNATSNPKLQRNLSQLERITADVQKTAMSMRMVPVGQLFQKSVRLVRDLTRKSGKQATLEIEGEETELDRTIVELLADPLMHMIRNSADHGIEPPAERSAAGKSPMARILLKAYHQSGHIVIEIDDDGRGLDRQKILKKARERGLVQDGAALTDKEVFNLIFEPGFSTAEKVTDVSGRGVGMDVVRKHVQKLRGSIDIQSTAGQGTTFFIKLPLTLAIIDGLVVRAGGERCILPIYAVREIFRPKPETRFTVEGRDEMVLVRDTLLPVMRLDRCFGAETRSGELSDGVLVVAEALGKRFCLFVDQVLGKQEVVIKSLGETFKRLPGISGGTILGDGRVALILDMDSLLGTPTHA